MLLNSSTRKIHRIEYRFARNFTLFVMTAIFLIGVGKIIGGQIHPERLAFRGFAILFFAAILWVGKHYKNSDLAPGFIMFTTALFSETFSLADFYLPGPAVSPT